jgi:hypothetical protein
MSTEVDMSDQPFYTVKDDQQALKSVEPKRFFRAQASGSDLTYWLNSHEPLEAHFDEKGFNFGAVYKKDNACAERVPSAIEVIDATMPEHEQAVAKENNKAAAIANRLYNESKQKQWHHLKKCCSDRFWARAKAAGKDESVSPSIDIFEKARKSEDVSWLFKRIGEVCTAVNSETVDTKDPSYIDTRQRVTSNAWHNISMNYNEDFPAFFKRFKEARAEFENVFNINVDVKVCVVRLYKALKKPYYAEFASQSAVLGYTKSLVKAEQKILDAHISAEARAAHAAADPSEVKQAAAYSFSSGKASSSHNKNGKKSMQSRGNNSRNENNNRASNNRNNDRGGNRGKGNNSQWQKSGHGKQSSDLEDRNSNKKRRSDRDSQENKKSGYRKSSNDFKNQNSSRPYSQKRSSDTFAVSSKVEEIDADDFGEKEQRMVVFQDKQETRREKKRRLAANRDD